MFFVKPAYIECVSLSRTFGQVWVIHASCGYSPSGGVICISIQVNESATIQDQMRDHKPGLRERVCWIEQPTLVNVFIS